MGQFCIQPFCLDLQHIAEGHVCSPTSPRLARLFYLSLSSLSSQGEAKWLNMLHLPQVFCFQTGGPPDGWKWHPVSPLTRCGATNNVPLYTPPTIPSIHQSFFPLHLILPVNWFSGERIPSGGEAHGGVWSPDWHHSAEEGDHWQQDQGGEGEVNTHTEGVGGGTFTADGIYFPQQFFLPAFYFTSCQFS